MQHGAVREGTVFGRQLMIGKDPRRYFTCPTARQIQAQWLADLSQENTRFTNSGGIKASVFLLILSQKNGE
jgi:hypothetical protein